MTNLKKPLLSAPLVLAGLLGVSAPAHALLVSGAWDPLYGASFAGLGWNGTANFEIVGPCSGAGCLASYLVDATVNFYNDGVPGIKATLTFTGNQYIVTSVAGVGAGFQINTIYTSAGALIVIDEPYVTAAGLDDFAWGLSFVGGQARLAFNALSGNDHDNDDDDDDDDDKPSCVFGTTEGNVCGVNDGNAFPANVTFTAVIPEPATYALMLAGLAAAVGVMARRRRQP